MLNGLQRLKFHYLLVGIQNFTIQNDLRLRDRYDRALLLLFDWVYGPAAAGAVPADGSDRAADGGAALHWAPTRGAAVAGVPRELRNLSCGG